MTTTSGAFCAQYGIDFPLFAFSHCRDVVAAVSNAGGFGVLGGAAYTPEQLDQELTWIDEHVNGKPYGIDIIVPAKFEGKGEKLSSDDLATRIPEGYREFVNKLLADHGIEPDTRVRTGRPLLAGGNGKELLEVAMSHPIRMMANALGVPPDYMIEAGRERGIPVAALVGAKEHALKQVAAGVDLIVAQGTEAGGIAARSARWSWFRRSSTRSTTRCRYWPPAASSPDGRWQPRSRWARSGPGPVRCG